jgi:hypothetical protein
LRARFLPELDLIIALRIARCWRWTADTAALLRDPVTELAQLSMMLRGVPFTLSSQWLALGLRQSLPEAPGNDH